MKTVGMMMKIKIIEMLEKHHSFVIANWIQQYWDLMHYPQPPKTATLVNHQRLIKGMDGRGSRLAGWVAVSSEDEDQYLGFIVSSGDYAHFIFVKDLFRGVGIGRALWTHAGEPRTYTHIVRGLRERLPRSFVFNPYPFTLGDSYVSTQGTKHSHTGKASEARSIDPRHDDSNTAGFEMGSSL
jgi:GNAT superfamily N-acetyltransferase